MEKSLINAIEYKLINDEKFSQTLITNHYHYKRIMTSEEALLGIFGTKLDDYEESRIKLYAEIEGLKSECDKNDISSVVLWTAGCRKKTRRIDGYKFNYNVFRKLCINFNEDLYDYYIELENMMLDLVLNKICTK